MPSPEFFILNLDKYLLAFLDANSITMIIIVMILKRIDDSNILPESAEKIILKVPLAILNGLLSFVNTSRQPKKDDS